MKRFPPPRGACRADGRRRSDRDPLDDPRRRDHRDPLRAQARRLMGRSAIPEPVTAVTELAGRLASRPRLEQVEERLAEIAAGPGRPIADDAGATLAAGGKRMRPLLVLLCAGRDAGERAIRAATAIELVHMATLVHDDVLDDASLRRGRPTVVASAGRGRALATGDLLFSRAFAELAAPGSEAQVATLATASVALARGELAQRQDAFRIGVSADRYYLRCRLKTAALFECACVVGARAPAGRARGPRRLRPRDRPRLPAARRRPRRPRPAAAHRQGAGHRPARRDRQPAPDPGPRTRPGPANARPEERWTRPPPSASATASPPPARPSGPRRGPRAGRERQARAPRRRPRREDRALFELVADGVVERYS